MTRMFFLILFLISSCGSEVIRNPIERNGVLIEEEFIPHVEEFENQCDEIVDVPIKFAKLPGSIIGMCVWFLGPYPFRYMMIDENYWKYADYYDRESLIFHEIGHCVLNEFHENEKNKQGKPISLMNSYSFSSYWYYQNRRKMVDALCPDKKSSKAFKYTRHPWASKLFLPYSSDKFLKSLMPGLDESSIFDSSRKVQNRIPHE